MGLKDDSQDGLRLLLHTDKEHASQLLSQASVKSKRTELETALRHVLDVAPPAQLADMQAQSLATGVASVIVNVILVLHCALTSTCPSESQRSYCHVHQQLICTCRGWCHPLSSSGATSRQLPAPGAWAASPPLSSWNLCGNTYTPLPMSAFTPSLLNLKGNATDVRCS